MKSLWSQGLALRFLAVIVFLEVFGMIAETPSISSFLKSELDLGRESSKPISSRIMGDKLSFSAKDIAGTGTAVALTNDGFLITNAHVVDGCDSVILDTADGGFEATLVRESNTYDLAILRVQLNKPSKTLRFRIKEPELGAAVTVYGYPLSSVLSRNGNLTFGNVSALDGGATGPHLIQLSASIQPGSSGSGVFNSNGELVGIVESKLDSLAIANALGDIPQNVNFAVSSPYVKDIFEEYDGYDHAVDLSLFFPSSAEDVIEKAISSTVLIKCIKDMGGV